LVAAPTAELLRDPWGTPHIFATTETEGFFGLGYAAAEDRLLQMELIRRKAAGRLAEVFGPDWVDADREARIAGHAPYAPRAFAKLPERWQNALRAYAAGVNAWREANPEAVARRFQPLGIEPKPWTPTDCLLASRGILSLGSPFSAGPIEDYHRFRELVAQVGEGDALRQSNLVIDDSAAIVSEAEMAKDSAVYQRLKQRERMPGWSLRPAGGDGEGPKMSHAWAVSGRRSTTGQPILESDPQLPLSSPPFFYEFHLAAGRIDARGLGIPGCPGLFIGWNRRIAWGASALGVDAHVTFLDRLTADGKGYVFEGQSVPFERRLERIEVKGGQAVIQEVLTSRHGTVFNSLVGSPRAGEAHLLHDAQTMDHGANARMMLEVMDAGNWNEFRRALEHYYSPGLHIVYADVDGNVGYHTMVHRPLTPRSPRRALEGWTGRDEVRGRIPFDELPHLLNPDSGVISHANNLPVGSWYPYDLGLATGGTGHTSRSLRLQELLKGDRKFSVDDFELVLHRDDVNPIVATLLPIARKVVEEDQVNDAAVLGLLEAVKGWDMHEATAERFPAARGLGNTLTPYRGAGLNGIYGAGGGGVANLAREVGERFTRGGRTPTNTLVRAYLVNWLRASATGGRGGRVAARTTAIPYQLTLPHNLPVVDASMDFTSPPLTCLDTGTIWSQPGNLYSQIVDLSDLDNSRSMIAPGNAEDGPFRTNQVDIWVRGTLHTAPLSRAKVEALGVKARTLTAVAYDGSLSSPENIVNEAPREARFVPAIPPVTATANAEPKPLPGRKPDDPRLESAFRVILRQGTPNEEVDAQLADCRAYVKGNAGLTEQLRSAALLGEYLIEESAAGRLKVKYGSPYVLEKLKTLLNDLGNRQSSDSARPDPGRSQQRAESSRANLPTHQTTKPSDELAQWDDAAAHRSATGPGGTEWDAPYRSFIQTDENATSKGLPTHADAARQILADAAMSPDHRRRHLGWVLYIKHFSQAYRPEPATADLKRLYQALAALKPVATSAAAARPFDGDARLTIHHDVVYGKTHPEIQTLDVYLAKAARPTPVVIEIHGGGWRRGSKSEFTYPGDLIGDILAAGISVVSIDYRLSPRHTMPAPMEDVARAVQFVRSKAREWNLDPNRIAALGGSAGAHLGAWVALHNDLARPDSADPVECQSSRLTCFVALWGPMDLTRIRPTQLAQQPLRGQDFANAFTAAFGCTAEQFEQDPLVRQRIRDASPLFLASSDDPPAFVLARWSEDLTVRRDPPVPAVINDPHSAWHSVLLAEALVKAGGTVVRRLGPEVGKDPQADAAAILAFLRQQLLSPSKKP
jgi:penicillin amidase